MRALGILLVGVVVAVLPMTAQAGGGGKAKCGQTDYRWRNDNGSESTATWKTVDPNTPITGVKRAENIRLRFAVVAFQASEEGAKGAVTNGILEYAEGSTNGPWTDVPVNVGKPFRMATTTGYMNGDLTTAQLPVAGRTFVAGECVEDPANAGRTYEMTTNQYANLEYCFQATDYAKPNTTYYFRIGNLDAYQNHAALTMEDVAAPPPTDLYVDDADPNTIRFGYSWPASGITSNAWYGGCSYGLPTNEAHVVSFRWIPDVPTTATYNVYARWTYGPLRGMNVPYAIRHAEATNQVCVNQRDQSLSARWNLLGTYSFNAGTNGWIEMGGNDGQACADAVWLERVGGAPLDADGDGMLDSWETTYLGGTSASPTADADSDGMNNLQEFLAGMNPNDPKSVLAITALTGSGNLKWLSADGKTYAIQKSTNLTQGFPLTEASGIRATPPTNTHAVTVGASGTGFYRVKLETRNWKLE